MNKEEIRRDTLKKRLSQSTEDVREKSQKILLNLSQTIEYKNSQNILFYAATKSEVQTEEIIKMSIKMGKNVFIPIILPEYPDLIPSKIYDFDVELEKGSKGILQPKKEYQRLCPPEDLDLIIVPGVAFDSQGNRIGRGLGYYDNFLKKVRSSVKIIALAFEIQIVKKIISDKNDIPVHKIITEKRIINSI
ncbi:MAG TPA: 5-formyltetrahydrofolate cyclo-ligase [Candidatus Atribacteria bacterium]|nr:5-formyltetrahydrofolate cyclo-ligase [Candidatus Atribacteria bacterium]